MHFIALTLFFLIWAKMCDSKEPIWINATVKMAHVYFDRPVILILNAAENSKRPRTILQDDIFDSVNHFIQRLGNNWSIINSDLKYQKPERGEQHLGLGLARAHQIIGIIDQSTGLDRTKFGKIVDLWQQHELWFSRGKILVIVQALEEYSMEISQIVMRELRKQLKAINVALLACHGNTATLFTWDGYQDRCRADPYVAGYWNNYTSYNFSIFPVRYYKNVHQCKLVAVPAVLPPFVQPPDENYYFHEGIEVKLFLLLAKELNFSFVYKEVPNGENPWANYVNGVPAGVIGVLYRREGDIAFGGLRFTYQRSLLASNVDSYYADDLSWIGPTSRRTARWKAYFLIFPKEIWSCVLTVVICTFILVAVSYHIKKLKMDITTAFVVVWSISMNSPIPSYYFTNRIFFCMYILYALIINSLYSSILFKVLSKGLKTVSINSAMEAAEAGLTASIFASNIPEMEVAVPAYYKYITERNLVRWSSDTLGCMSEAAKHGTCYALFPALGGKYHINMRFTSASGRRYVRLFNERYASYEPVFYMPRHHPLLPIFRVMIRRLVESGIVLKHINEILISSFLKRANYTEVKVFLADEVKNVLSVSQVIGIFVLCSGLLFLAFISFMLEFFYYRKNTIIDFIL